MQPLCGDDLGQGRQWLFETERHQDEQRCSGGWRMSRQCACTHMKVTVSFDVPGVSLWPLF